MIFPGWENRASMAQRCNANMPGNGSGPESREPAKREAARKGRESTPRAGALVTSSSVPTGTGTNMTSPRPGSFMDEPSRRNTERAKALLDTPGIRRAILFMLHDDRSLLVSIIANELDAQEAFLLGKAPVPELRGKIPVVLYFDNDKDRSEFVDMMREAKPGMETRTLPPAQ